MNRTEISSLPDELLEMVFSNFSLSQRKKARLVCRQWRNVCYSATLTKNEKMSLGFYKDLSLLNSNGRFSHIEIKDFQSVNCRRNDDDIEEYEDCVEFWSKCGEHVKSLDLKKASLMSPLLRGIFPNTPNLESLTLTSLVDKGAFDQPEHLLLHFAFRNLRSLHIDYNKKCTGDQLLELVANAPMLNRLSLFSVSRRKHSVAARDPGSALGVLAERHQNHLTELKLDIWNLSDTNLRKLILNLSPQMVELDLRGCRKITDICLPLIAENLPNLQKISLTSPVFSDKAVRNLLKSLKHVTHVYLEDARVGHLTAAVIPTMTQLRHLSLAGTSGRTFGEECLRKAFASNLLQLTELCLEHSRLTDQLAGNIFVLLPNLTAFSLSNCFGVTGKTLRHIATYCKKLTSLTLTACYSVKDISPVVALPELKRLGVFDCPITEDMWCKYRDKLRNVEVRHSPSSVLFFSFPIPRLADH